VSKIVRLLGANVESVVQKILKSVKQNTLGSSREINDETRGLGL
jgi:hypothetical protein